ncbi:uncharacterized protein LOC113274127 [Papaver somniferum]|uniref:uncharacterized protein LOC113274127 n=1 Tax=Papaver somniferum TaxID=3469 RepID=UPI000E6F92A1|nr:uncharacterized protein LOC113274127 [Papaver somniferum]
MINSSTNTTYLLLSSQELTQLGEVAPSPAGFSFLFLLSCNEFILLMARPVFSYPQLAELGHLHFKVRGKWTKTDPMILAKYVTALLKKKIDTTYGRVKITLC